MNIESLLSFSVAILLSLATSVRSQRPVKMTIMFYDNQHLGLIETKETLVLDSLIDPRKMNIDVYFFHREYHIPYYLPTGGIYKDSLKDAECHAGIFPSESHCYRYDKNKRVISMSVNGSGATGQWSYTYDRQSRIVIIDGLGHFTVKYGKLGFVTELTQESGDVKKRFVATYD